MFFVCSFCTWYMMFYHVLLEHTEFEICHLELKAKYFVQSTKYNKMKKATKIDKDNNRQRQFRIPCWQHIIINREASLYFFKISTMEAFVFSDLIAVTSSTLPELSFMVKGRPPVQRCPKIAWRTRRGRAPLYYDPSSRDKRAWRLMLQKGLADCGVTLDHPFFQTKHNNLQKGLFWMWCFFVTSDT